MTQHACDYHQANIVDDQDDRSHTLKSKVCTTSFNQEGEQVDDDGSTDQELKEPILHVG